MAVAEPRVWATRPEHQNAQWCQTLAELGHPVVDLPLMLIQSVSDPAEIQAVKNLILDFDQFHKVIFVSQNAVREAFAWLRDYWPQLPVGVEYFAVGSKTAEAAMAEGLTVVNGTQAMDSDELLALPELQNVWGQKVLICRGRGGLPRMGEALHERGAIVRYCELYHRRLPTNAAAAAAAFLAHGCATDVIPVFSGESLQNLVRVLDANSSSERSMRLVVPGKRVTQAAEKLGFSRVITAENATNASMLAAVREALAM
jgi:uroporphyrinogen-III synthase